jgi:hypothetical protein
LSLRAFAQREGFNAHTFWMWKKRLRGIRRRYVPQTLALQLHAAVMVDHTPSVHVMSGPMSTMPQHGGPYVHC